MDNNYFFVQSLQSSLSALRGAPLESIDAIAYAILLVTLFVGIYEAFVAGASVGKLVGSVVKYVAAAGLIANWYAFFTAVYTSATTLATSIARQDFVESFRQYLAHAHTAFTQPTVFNFITMNVPTLVGGLLFVVVPLLFWLAMVLFELLFTIWGCILFCIGPLLIALFPSVSLNNFSKTYMKSLAEWALWPVLYAIMGALALTVSTHAFSAYQSSNSFVDVLNNATNLTMMMFQAVTYILLMILIPIIAHLITRGSFDGVFFAAVGAVTGANKMINPKTHGKGSEDGGGSSGSASSAPSQTISQENRAPRATA